MVSGVARRKGIPGLLLRIYYTPYSSCYLRCLSGCFSVAICFCGPGVSVTSRCGCHLDRRGHLISLVPFRRPMGIIRNRCLPGSCFRCIGNLRGRPRNKGQYRGYFELQLRSSTRCTGRRNFSCFAAALAVDPLGGTRLLGSVNTRLTRECNVP